MRICRTDKVNVDVESLSKDLSFAAIALFNVAKGQEWLQLRLAASANAINTKSTSVFVETMGRATTNLSFKENPSGILNGWEEKLNKSGNISDVLLVMIFLKCIYEVAGYRYHLEGDLLVLIIPEIEQKPQEKTGEIEIKESEVREQTKSEQKTNFTWKITPKDYLVNREENQSQVKYNCESSDVVKDSQELELFYKVLLHGKKEGYKSRNAFYFYWKELKNHKCPSEDKFAQYFGQIYNNPTKENIKIIELIETQLLDFFKGILGVRISREYNGKFDSSKKKLQSNH